MRKKPRGERAWRGIEEEKCKKCHAVKGGAGRRRERMSKKATRYGAKERKSDEKVTHSGTGRGIEARKCDICPAVGNMQGVEVENCHIYLIHPVQMPTKTEPM